MGSITIDVETGLTPKVVAAINATQGEVTTILLVGTDAAAAIRIKQQLVEYGLVAEEYGGDVTIRSMSLDTVDEQLLAKLDAMSAALDAMTESFLAPDQAIPASGSTRAVSPGGDE